MTAETAPPADHVVREMALDPTRSFIVEAPAGSGKTELLTRRFLKLLSTVREPEEVLAITFTRKAAAEMRSRILRALELADGSVPPSEGQRAVWTLARVVRAADERYDWQLRSHPSRLRIMTIDALNNFLARQLPILSGVGAMLRIADEPKKLYADTVLRMIERLSSRDAENEPIARLLQHLDNRYESFESLLSRELERREYWLDLGLLRYDLPRLRAQLEAALKEAIETELQVLRELVPRDVAGELISLVTHAAAVLNGMGIDSPIAACDDLTGAPRAECEALKHWRGIAELLLTKTGGWRARIDKNIGFPPDNKAVKQRLSALLERLQREDHFADALHRTRELPAPSYSDAQWQTLTDLLAVLKLAIAELEVVMRERGEADYTANAIAARRALGSSDDPTDLALRLDYRLQHILVDEFQDTSRGQIELLALLTAGWSDGDGHSLFCVGDPMQSIYRFRNADVGLFLNLKRNGLNQLRITPLRLTVNFRSARPVLEWVNRAFVDALPRRDDPERGAVAFTASDARPKAPEQGGVFVHAIVGERRDARLAEAEEIGGLIEKVRRAEPDARIAVLVSNRLHLQGVIRELRARGIEFAAVDIDPLATRPAIQDAIALTRALVHLADRTAWLAVLRAPWCGLSIEDLYALCGGDDAPLTVWQMLDAEDRTARLTDDGRRRLALVVDTLRRAVTLRGRMGLRDCVERAWVALGGPATVESASALRDCEMFFSRLEAIERSGDLEDVARLEDSLRDLYAADSESADVKVELMTVHRAKGLEFDVVILPGLDSGSKGDEPPLLRTQGSSHIGDRGLLLAPIAPKGSENDGIYAWLESLDKERARLERGRLLYVAATRAVRELHLFGAIEDGRSARANTFLQLLWPTVAADFERVAPVEASIAAASRRDTSGIRTRRLPNEWKIPRPTPTLGESRLKNLADDEPLLPEFAWVGETARHVGTVVHREIERIASGTGQADTAALRDTRRYEIALAELGVPPHLREAAARRIETALTSMINDDRGRWLLAGTDVHREAHSEFAVSGKVGGQLVNGVIDRTLVDRDGVRWIVDFKTSTHEGAGLEEFLANEQTRYLPQLQTYAQLIRELYPQDSVKAALYFPLLGAWREVGVG